MKNLALFTGVLAVSLFASCSGRNKHKRVEVTAVPAAVTSVFISRFPNATDVEWSTEMKENRVVYEADYKVDGKEGEIEFDEMGNVLEAESPGNN